jgi:hypothetical protein
MLMIDSEGNIIDEYPETPWQGSLEEHCSTMMAD